MHMTVQAKAAAAARLSTEAGDILQRVTRRAKETGQVDAAAMERALDMLEQSSAICRALTNPPNQDNP